MMLQHSTFRIKRSLASYLQRLPVESCGFLLGYDGVYVDDREVANVASRAGEFKASRLGALLAIVDLWTNRYDSVALYHVHRRVAVPSDLDFKYMPSVLTYVIVTSSTVAAYVKSPLGCRAMPIEYVEEARRGKQ